MSMLVPQVKIAVPPLPPEFVARRTLRAELDNADPTAVGLVCAPAGYGKTLLLADWARTSTETETAWVGLDRDDNDPRRLWGSVVAALATCSSVPATSRLRAPLVWRAGGQPEFLAELVAALQALPRPVRLILDDVQELVEAEALHGLRTYLRTRPDRVQLVLCGRIDPPLSLPRLRLAGRLWELRAERMRFSAEETAALLTQSGLHLPPAQVQLLHQRTDGWVAGVRLAALAIAELGDRDADRDAFLANFSGNDRAVADYLVGEVLSRLPEQTQDFLRLISISDPIPSVLAAELSGRAEAGSLLDGLERRTALVAATGPDRDSYRVHELLRTYLLADLHRQGPARAADLHAVAARWWARQARPTLALNHAVRSNRTDLLARLLHQCAVALIVTGEHGSLRRALSTLGAEATATDPMLAVTSALTYLEVGEIPAACRDLDHARRSWPDQDAVDLAVLRAVAEQFSAQLPGDVASDALVIGMAELPPEPGLEALARLGRGMALLLRGERRTEARTDFEAALALARHHGFDYLALQCLALLGLVAALSGDVPTVEECGNQARKRAAARGWEGTRWSAIATTLLAYLALQRADAPQAQRLAAEGLSLSAAASAPALKFALRVIHGTAVFDRGERARGLTEVVQARSDLGDHPIRDEQAAAAALLEFRAALLLGHSAAAQTAYGWLADRTGTNAELLLMRAWAKAASGHHEPARAITRPVVEGEAHALLPYTLVEAWLLETALAVSAGERPSARRALQIALAVARPLGAVRPFTLAAPSVRELLVHQQGTFGDAEPFAEQVLAAGAGRADHRALLSERELTVLTMLPSLLSLDEIAADLTVSVNTVKSHVRSIYTKLGVSSRRTAVLVAREHGLIKNALRPV